VKKEKRFSCDEARYFVIRSYGTTIYIVNNRISSEYLFSDGKVRNWGNLDMPFEEANKLVYYKTREQAEDVLRRFKEKMCKSANAVSRQPLHLQLENETSPVIQPITARLVTDHSGGRIVLQVQTPETPEFIPVARLAVKNGKVVMYREQGVESEFINTDSQGRIQN